jgi:hypothetical protein
MLHLEIDMHSRIFIFHNQIKMLAHLTSHLITFVNPSMLYLLASSNKHLHKETTFVLGDPQPTLQTMKLYLALNATTLRALISLH